MIRNFTLSLCALCLISVSGRAQDIHFTLYDMMPLVFNPAETGAFSGTYRISAIYRDQWLSVTGVPNEYKTPAASVDLPIIKGFRENDWVGVGLMMFSDKSGSLALKHSAFKLSAAYHLALDKKGNTMLSFGYQTGSVQQEIKNIEDVELLVPDTQLEGSMLKDDYIDHVGGLHLRTIMNKTNVLQLGVSVGHIGEPQFGLDSGGGGGMGGMGGSYQIPMRILSHGSYRAMYNDRLAITPSAFFQVLGKDSEIMVQAVGEYLFNPQKQIVLKGGLGYRVGDAVQLILGTDIKDLKVTFGYDINVSRLTPASNTFGGFEISASLIGVIYKKPNPDPVLFCPRF